MPNKKEEKKQPSNKWWCNTCQSGEMTMGQMKVHLETHHGLDTKTAKFSKRMTVHMDGSDWYSSQYELKTKTSKGEIELTNSVVSLRSPEDAAYWAGGDE